MPDANTAIKYRAFPSQEQKTIFAKTFGCCRAYWNMALDDRQEIHDDIGIWIVPRPAEYKSMKEYSWLKEPDSLALANTQQALEQAYKNYFANPKHFGLPKHKKRQGLKGSYSTNCQYGTDKNGNRTQTIEIVKNSVKLPKISAPKNKRGLGLGNVKIIKHRNIPSDAIIKGAVVERDAAGDWWIVIQYYDPAIDGLVEKLKLNNDELDVIRATGLDYSSPFLFVNELGLSPGSIKHYAENQVKLARLQRKLAKKEKGSNGYRKLSRRIARLHRRIANQRNDFLHKLSCTMSKAYDLICVESLDLKGIANKKMHLGKATFDNAWGTFVTMLAYKMAREGGGLVKVGRFYASSKTCHHCGAVNDEVVLGMDKWACPECGAEIERDPNAAKNILFEGLRMLYSGEVTGVGISPDRIVVDAGGMPVACGLETQGCQMEGCKTWLDEWFSRSESSSEPVESGIKEDASQSIVDNTVDIETLASEAPASAARSAVSRG